MALAFALVLILAATNLAGIATFALLTLRGRWAAAAAVMAANWAANLLLSGVGAWVLKRSQVGAKPAQR